MELNDTKCSHCGAVGSITETLDRFYCDECGWWGYRPEKMEFPPDDQDAD